MSAALLRQRRPFSEAATAAADASSASTSTSEAFGPGTTRLSDAAEEALNDIGESVQKTRKKVQLTKADLRKLQGNPRKYRLIGDRPEFHNVERNKNGHICEPTDKFQVVITSSKNNCWINVRTCTAWLREGLPPSPSQCVSSVCVSAGAEQVAQLPHYLHVSRRQRGVPGGRPPVAGVHGAHRTEHSAQVQAAGHNTRGRQVPASDEGGHVPADVPRTGPHRDGPAAHATAAQSQAAQSQREKTSVSIFVYV